MLQLRRVDIKKYLDIFCVDNKKLNRTVNAFDLYLLMVYFPGILKTRNCVVERLVFCAQQHPSGICVYVFWEQECFSLLNGKARPLLTVTLLCGRASSQCYCVLTGSYFHSRSVSKAGRGRNMPSDAHSWLQAHPLTCVCANSRTVSYAGLWSWTMTCSSSGCLCHFLCLWEVIQCCCRNQMQYWKISTPAASFPSSFPLTLFLCSVGSTSL